MGSSQGHFSWDIPHTVRRNKESGKGKEMGTLGWGEVLGRHSLTKTDHQ
jgi:hypothetical protein